MIREIAPCIWGLEKIISPQDLKLILDEFEYTTIQLNKVEKFDSVPKNAPRWGYLRKGTKDLLGDNFTLIKYAELYKLLAAKIVGKRLELTRINTNIQQALQDSTFHVDGGINSWTLLIFLSTNWDTNWGGEFVCQTKEQNPTYVSVPYIPGNGALFRGDLWHRGAAPNYMCEEVRLSLAFTYTEI